MKRLILTILFGLVGCTNATGLDMTQMGNVSIDTEALVELISPENQTLIAGLTPEQAIGVVVIANQEEPTEPPWQPEARWIHMFGADGNLIIDGDFRYEERVADDMPFELRLRMYVLQAESMNRPVQNGGDPRCTCTVMHGGPGGGI